MVKSLYGRTVRTVIKPLIFIGCLIFSTLGSAQNELTGTKILDSLISKENYKEAKKTLQKDIALLRSKKSYFLLTDYTYYVGKINLELQNPTAATKAVDEFLASISKATDSVKVLRQAQLELASYWEFMGDTQKAYRANIEAIKLTSQLPKATPEDFGFIENNLAALSSQNGDIAQGVKHSLKAIKYYESYPKTDKKNLYIAYNSMGACMWYTSKIDSALYYFGKAEKMLKELEPTPINQYYRPAFVTNNMAAIYGSQGNTDAALEAMKQTITYLHKFIKSDAVDYKKEDAKEFLFQAIENYGGIYKDIGNLGKAQELLEYVYKEKKKHFVADHTELFKSKILLGQVYLAQKEYQLAKNYLEDGISHIKRIESGNDYWEADAHFSLAQLHQELGDNTMAATEFRTAESLYENALDESYDEQYLDFIKYASHFYAKNNDAEKAMSMANKAFEYVKKNQGTTTSFEIEQGLNIGKLDYELGHYQAAFDRANESFELLKKTLPTQTNPLDSTRIIVYKPQIILLKTQSAFQLEKNKSIDFLKREFNEVQEAIHLIEQQKIMVGEDSNVSLLIDSNTRLFEFAKQLRLQLYEKTKDKKYLEDLMAIHESSIYNRIRSRLNLNSNIAFMDVPKNVTKREQTLKTNISKSLNDSDDMSAYFNGNTSWTNFLDTLKQHYPNYYKMRYATIEEPLNELQKNIPKNTTVVRYFYVDTLLYAFIADRKETHIFKLESEILVQNIHKLSENTIDFSSTATLLSKLYQQLWFPFESKISTEHVIIIPDGALFNLSFETLTPTKIKAFKELSTNSLLSKYSISYNYSLLLLNKKRISSDYAKNFVGFAPEFNDGMKTNYKNAVTDALTMDHTYLSLLPQPTSLNLAKKYSNQFNGEAFVNENASKRHFTSHAKNHKIIYIGTHAESNNLSPELSRLVFAKSLDSLNSDDNSLYTYEIYDTDLASNLTILTACETGKPTYQAGEGMISLAHAFNYAGSESILTSLWKIDEQSSAKIVDLFYINLDKGWTKDKALRQAKLDYIATAEGRTANPQYWAGLVLIGDVSPIEMTSSINWIYWIFASVLLLVVTFVFYIKRSRGQNKNLMCIS